MAYKAVLCSIKNKTSKTDKLLYYASLALIKAIKPELIEYIQGDKPADKR